MRLPKLTLRMQMVVVAVVACVLALPSDTREILLILAIPAAVIALFPYQVRLAIELPILVMCFVAAGWQRESQFYGGQADRVTFQFVQASGWVVTAKSLTDCAILCRESTWFARKSVTIRFRAIWTGLRYGNYFPSGEQLRQESIYLNDLLWEIQRRETVVWRAHQRSVRRP